MALIDVKCGAGHESEVYRPAADWPATPACPTCGAATTQFHTPPPTRYSVDPVVIYRAPDGTFRFPGDTTALSTAKYDRAGLERIELRNHADVRRFESHMNKREQAIASRKVERQLQMREEREHDSRGNLRMLMQSMSRRGRDVARAMIDRNDAKPRPRVLDSGFHVDCYSNNRSNRDESRDAQGRRRRD